MTTPEHKVKARLHREINKLQIVMWDFMPVQMGMGKPALDILFCVRDKTTGVGRFVAIETKAKGKKLTSRQQQTKTEMEAAGAKVFVVDDDESMNIALNWLQEYVANNL